MNATTVEIINLNGSNSVMSEKEKRWCLTADNQIKWVHTFLTGNIEWDDGFSRVCVVMSTNGNAITSPKDCEVISIDPKDLFASKKEAQFEIIRRERFGN